MQYVRKLKKLELAAAVVTGNITLKSRQNAFEINTSLFSFETHENSVILQRTFI